MTVEYLPGDKVIVHMTLIAPTARALVGVVDIDGHTVMVMSGVSFGRAMQAGAVEVVERKGHAPIPSAPWADVFGDGAAEPGESHSGHEAVFLEVHGRELRVADSRETAADSFHNGQCNAVIQMPTILYRRVI